MNMTDGAGDLASIDEKCLSISSGVNICMIKVPANVWLPKVVSRYTTLDYYGDDIDNHLDYGQYDNCVYKNNLAWSEHSSRNDIISYNKAKHCDELKKDFRFDESIDDDTHSAIIDVIKKTGIASLR